MVSDVWSCLKNTDKPIIMYGTGDGGDKIFAVLDRLGIKVDGIFASDGFVRNRSFHGIKVESYSDIVRRYGDDITVLISFGSSRPEVLETFAALTKRHEVLVPDVPVAGEELFNGEYYEKHSEELAFARNLFADTESRVVFDNIVSGKLSGRAELLFDCVTDETDVMNSVLHPINYRAVADIGAYTGDTLMSLMTYAPNIDTAIAIEPDRRNFAKLCLNTEGDERVERHMEASWNVYDVLSFRDGGGRGIRRGKEKTVEVIARPFDSTAGGRRIDYIKYDVEGAESEALEGSAKTIAKYSPELCVAAYHRSCDIFSLPKQIIGINPAYKLYLRRYMSFPYWDINIFAAL